jgi:hypothetical protein
VNRSEEWDGMDLLEQGGSIVKFRFPGYVSHEELNFNANGNYMFLVFVTFRVLKNRIPLDFRCGILFFRTLHVTNTKNM